MEEYKGFTIEIIPGYCGGKPTVQYCGDDIIFESAEEAKKFIDEITEGA